MQTTSADGKIRYQQLTSKYLDDACDVVRASHFTTGNVTRALGLPKDPEALSELDQLPRLAAEDGISVIAIDTTKDKVVAFCFNKLRTPNSTYYEDLKKSFKNTRALKMLEFITSTKNLCNIFEFCQVDCVMEIFLLGTLPEYRKQGIAKKLSELSLNIAQNLFNGVNVKQSIHGKELPLEPRPKAVTGIFTSFISQRIARQLGFKIAAEVNNSEIKIMGETLKISAEAATPATTLEYKKL